MAQPSQSPFQGLDTPFLKQLYQQYENDPSSVSLEWQTFFKSLGGEALSREEGQNTIASAAAAAAGPASDAQNKVSSMINSYRSFGHQCAHTNPLLPAPELSADFSPESFGVGEKDLDQTFATDGLLSEPYARLRDILGALRKTYTSTIGAQVRDIAERDQRRWVTERMESTHNRVTFSKEEKTKIYDGLVAANEFEQFLHTKYVGVKRFSLEGGDALIPMLQNMVEKAGDQGMSDIILGMAHRGRLNVLTNIMNKPLEQMIGSFENALVNEDGVDSAGDVKYHMGYSYDVTTKSGQKIHMSLLNNPSHLEAVNPVVAGTARAKQDRIGDKEGKKVLPVVIHGDSAFAGQGVVPETMNLAQLEGFNVGGTIHVVINNRVGFTAEPQEVFSGEYCTDMARMLQIPIFHVNGDDPEACVHTMQMAMDWREKFGRDVMIDLVCYRRFGHNEGDDPTFTQPKEYELVKKHPVPFKVYKEELTKEGVVSEAELKTVEDAFRDKINAAYETVKKGKVKVSADVFGGAWEGLDYDANEEPKTAISKKLLGDIAQQASVVPEGFTPHPKIAKLLEQRTDMLNGKSNLNWGAAEMAGFASLLAEGRSIRLTGQDVQRATFSHRHGKIVDHKTGERTIPMEPLATNGAQIEMHNSSLSEEAVLAYEYGYTLAAPNTLTIWEAQFGDFANGAQIPIDQFISSSETKWQRMTGLVMLLPHGSEGQGPEHSSARPERFLQLCGEENMIVCNLTTPAQIFHVLRRQMLRKFRKPLIVMSPKSLLRHPLAVSTVDDIAGKDAQFYKVIDDDITASKVKRVILCSGKVYYDLLARRNETGQKDVALIRIEQLYPLFLSKIQRVLKAYKKAEIVWVQEEPRNQGYWTHILDTLVPHIGGDVRYIGRPAAASPAVGLASRHAAEQKKVIDEAFKIKKGK